MNLHNKKTVALSELGDPLALGEIHVLSKKLIYRVWPPNMINLAGIREAHNELLEDGFSYDYEDLKMAVSCLVMENIDQSILPDLREELQEYVDVECYEEVAQNATIIIGDVNWAKFENLTKAMLSLPKTTKADLKKKK